jgi:plastocyanin
MKTLSNYFFAVAKRATARVAPTGFNFIQSLYKIILVTLLFTSSQAFAEEKEFLVKIKDHKFEPASINVPANEKFKLVIENLDKTLEEFESVDLKKEKLVGGGKKITIVIAPLKSGEYKFFGDFHQKTAQGKIVAQ